VSADDDASAVDEDHAGSADEAAAWAALVEQRIAAEPPVPPSRSSERVPAGGTVAAGGRDLDDSIRLYLRDIAAVPLLTGAQEVALGRRLARGRDAADALARQRMDHGPDASTGHGLTAAQRTHEALVADGALARRQLTEANLRLVVSVAKGFVRLRSALSLLDLIQEGNLGLLRAIEKFDYTRGFRFSTYATWWIRQGILRALANQGRTIRVPVHIREAQRAMARADERLQQELGRVPRPEELAQELAVSADAVRELRALVQEPISLDLPLSETTQSTRGEGIPDPSATPLDLATRHATQVAVARVLAVLSERERLVLQLRFGFVDGRPRTLEEAGMVLHVTRERVRQLETHALRKLRQLPQRELLLDYVD
jgi:RNA polymerase primary sigma factor